MQSIYAEYCLGLKHSIVSNIGNSVKALRRIFTDLVTQFFEGFGRSEILRHPQQFFQRYVCAFTPKTMLEVYLVGVRL